MGGLLETSVTNAAAAAVLAVMAAVISQVCRRPALTHSLWLLVLVKLLTPPVVNVPVPWPSAHEAPANDSGNSVSGAHSLALAELAVVEEAVQVAETPPEAALPDSSLPTVPVEAEIGTPSSAPITDLSGTPVDWRIIVASVWVAGSVYWLAWTGWHVIRFQRLLRFARQGSPELQNQLRELSGRLGLKHCPALWLVPGAVSPMIWGLGRTPRLLFPAQLLARLDPEQRAALLIHELAHLKRRDHWVRLVELAAVVLYWWNPVVWWTRRELHEAEEQCCDAWVVWALDGAGRSYALALLETVAFFSNTRLTLPATATGIGQVPHLRRRLTMIMKGRTPRSLSWVGCCAVLGTALAFLPLFPVQAQPPLPERPGSQGGDDRDQQIEALKRTIQMLEAQRRAEHVQRAAVAALAPFDATNPGANVDPAEVQKALEEVTKVAKEMSAKQMELQKLHAEYQQALQRFARASGGRLPIAIPPAPAYPAPRLPAAAPGKSPAPDLPTPHAARPGLRPQGSDLEQRLERLLREVEELRRDISRGRPMGGTPGARPMTGGAAPAVPAVPPAVPGSPPSPGPSPGRVLEPPARNLTPLPAVPGTPVPRVVPPPLAPALPAPAEAPADEEVAPAPVVSPPSARPVEPPAPSPEKP
jgi:beta-lactamase regulating signal transducer with metallopeptidase domain